MIGTMQSLSRKTVNLFIFLFLNSTCLVLVALTLFLVASVVLMNGPDFSDETEKFLVAQLIMSGKILYKDIFVQHGILPYLYSHILQSLIPTQSLFWPRLIPIILALLSVWAIAASPIFTQNRDRKIAASLTLLSYTALLAPYSIIMTMYQVYCGFFFVIILALSVVPTIVGVKLRNSDLVVTGFCLASIGFNAFSYGIALVLVFVGIFLPIAQDRKEVLRYLNYIAQGSIICIVLTAVWMYFYGDWKGYFIYHVYFNVIYYSKYFGQPNVFMAFMNFLPGQLLFTDLFLFLSWHEYILFSLPPIMFGVLFLIKGSRSKYFILISLLLYTSVIYMNPRMSAGFASSTYVVISSGLASLVAAVCLSHQKIRDKLPTLWISAVISLFLVGGGMLANITVKSKLYELSALEYYQTKGNINPKFNSEINLARTIVNEKEGMLQLPFDLYRYVWVARMPAWGMFYYLPWMADYARDNPFPGYEINICKRIVEDPPKLIYYRDFEVWGHPTDKWLGCVKDALKMNYIFVAGLGQNGWVRADIVATRPDLLATAIITNQLDFERLNTTTSKILRDNQLVFNKFGNGQLCYSDYKEPELGRNIKTGSCEYAFQFGLRKVTETDYEFVESTTGACLEIEGASKNDGAPLRLWPCTKALNQIFIVTPVDTLHIEIQNKFSGKCLVITEGNATQKTCNETTRLVKQ